MAAAWGADGRAYWQVPFWLPCGAWHWQGAAPVWKPQSPAASDGEVGLGVFSKVRRCNKRHTNPRARLLNYLRRSWHELNNKFTQCRGEQSFNVDEWVAEHVNIKVHLAHNAQQKSNPTPLTSCQIVEAQETLIFAFKAQQLGMHICWKRFADKNFRQHMRGKLVVEKQTNDEQEVVGVDKASCPREHENRLDELESEMSSDTSQDADMRAMSDSEHTATTPMSSSDVKSESSHIECASSPSEFEPEWSAGTSEDESRVRVGVPSVAMPVAPAGVSPIAAGPKMDGDPQVTSVAMASPAVAVPVVPMDVVGAPPPLAATPPPVLPRRVASEPVVRGAPAAPPPQPAVPTATFVERLPPAQPVVPVGPAASSSHPQAEATAQEFLQWMQNGTERQEAWVKLIAMVIESLVQELVGPDTLTIKVFGSRAYKMALLDSDVDLCAYLGPSARYPGEDILFHVESRMTTLKLQA